MKKRRFSVLILAILLTIILTACQGAAPVVTTAAPTTTAATDTSPDTEGGFPITKEKVDLTIMVPSATNVEDMDTNGFTVYYENLTGVHIIWQVVPAANLADKVNMSLSSGDVPEVYMSCNITQTQQAVYGKQGLFIPLNTYIDQYSPTFKNIMASVPNLEAVLKMDDGNIYALPYVEKCTHCEVSNKMWVNKTWLDKLEIAVPTTTEDFYNMLVAFRDKDPNGNNLADEVPLIAATDGWNSSISGNLDNLSAYLYDPFVYTQLPAYLDNGKVKLSYLQDDWKDALKWLNKLYTEKLMYAQSLVMTVEQANTMLEFADPIVGAMTGGVPYNVSTGTKRFLDYVAIPPLQGPAGRLVTWGAYSQINPTSFVITNKCANPDIAFRWAAGMYEKNVAYQRTFGVEGVSWKILKPGETDKLDPNSGDPAEVAIFTDNVGWGDKQNYCWRHIGVRCDTPDFKDNRYPLLLPGTYETDLESRLTGDSVNNYNPFRPDISVVLPPLVYSEQQAADLANIDAVVKSYRDEMNARFITGDANIDTEWDNYIKEMSVKGADKLIQIYQGAYDAKYGK